MSDPDDFERISRELAERFSGTPGAQGMIFAGSAANPARRDRWSDHDFLALVDHGSARAARQRVDWLPDPERIAHIIREGGVGFAVVYDDGHLLEFALASIDELADAPLGDSQMAFGDSRTIEFWAQARERGAADGSADPGEEIALFLVKILVGYGRARRGERLSAQRFVRGWAVDHLLRAIRLRVEPAPDAAVDPLDPARRLEQAHPDIAARIDRALAQPVESSARELFALAREILEPEWPDFPTRAAEAVEGVLYGD